MTVYYLAISRVTADREFEAQWAAGALREVPRYPGPITPS